jgi:sulfide:quinone oxidoreductase
MKRIVILGAGTAGTLMANRLVRLLPRETHQITLIDRDDLHLYQPGLLFLPFGDEREADLVRSRRSVLDAGVTLRFAEIDRIAADEARVYLQGSEPLPYDVLIIATGTRILPEQTPGLMGHGWRDTAFDFYTLDGAKALAEKLDGFTGGRVVVNVVDMPIKCPVAPLEFLFLAESYFRKRGLRDKVEIVYATPLEGAFTKPRASAVLGGMLEKRGISVIGDFGVSEVDGERRVIKAFDGRETNYDLLVSVPQHGGAEAVARSGFGDASGFVPTDKHTLQSKAFPNIFALGDATDLPSSKAGAVAHFQGDVLVSNIARFLAEKPLDPGFDGHANCFIETGDGKAMLIDFNYETEPLPGRFPLPGVGPFTLLEESARNHWGKLAFKWVYWNLLVQGKELPIDHRMTLAGKWS